MSVLPPGPLRIVALVVTVGVTWIALSILLGGPGSHFPRIQQLFTSECGALPHPTAEATGVATCTCGLRLRVGAGAWVFCLLLAGRLVPSVCLLTSGAAFPLPHSGVREPK